MAKDNRKYPFNAMEVGEHRLVETDKPINVMSAAHEYGKNNGLRFSCGTTTKGNVRVWRDE